MKDFQLAAAAWQVKSCPEFDAACEAADRLNSDLGCASTLAFENAVWHHPHLKADPAWCRSVLVWVEAYRRWAEVVQPWGWTGPRVGPGLTLGEHPPSGSGVVTVDRLPPRPRLALTP